MRFRYDSILNVSRRNRSRLLKKPANFVLASLRSSEALEGIFRLPRSILRANGYTKCGGYLLAPSLAAALLDGLFEPPVETALSREDSPSAHVSESYQS
jgi:hypothetical protein